MKFTVKFRGPTGKWAFKMGETKVGLDFVDQAKTDLKLPDLAADRVRSSIHEYWNNSFITLTEFGARKSGHFVKTEEIMVEVPEGFLNTFAYLKPVITKEKTGEVKSVRAVWAIDEMQLIEAWMNDGYPLFWGFEPEEAPILEVDQ